MHELHIVDEQHKGGRAGRNLRRIVDAQSPAAARRGFCCGDCLADAVVQQPRADAPVGVFQALFHEREQLVHPLPGLGRDIDLRRIGHKRQIDLDVLFVFLDGIGVLFHCVPLVDDDDGGLALLVHIPRDFDILLGNALFGVDERQHNIRPAHCREGSDHAIPFDRVALNLSLFAHARRVRQDVLLPVAIKRRVNRVARRPRDVAHNAALLPQDFVRQGGLADIRLAHNGDIGGVLLRFLHAVKIGNDLV